MIGTKLYRSENILDVPYRDVPYRDVPKKQKGHFSIEQNAIDNTTAGSLVDWPVSLTHVQMADWQGRLGIGGVSGMLKVEISILISCHIFVVFHY